jgi:hypothetical protein
LCKNDFQCPSDSNLFAVKLIDCCHFFVSGRKWYLANSFVQTFYIFWIET